MTGWTESEIAAQVPALTRYARMLSRNVHDAEELVQQALLQAYEKAPTFKSGAALKPWLLAILHNQFLMSRRAEQTRRSRETEYAKLPIHEPEQLNPELGLFVEEVAGAFATLSEDHRSVFHLIAIEEMTYRDAAETLGLPIGTIMSRLARARAALKEALAGKDRPNLRLIGGRDDL